MKKRAWFIFLGGLFVAVVAYACVYLAGTATQRSVDNSGQPALAWMQKEYQLDDAQFARLCEVHDGYLPKCMEMCRMIDEKNAQVEKLLAATNVITPEIREALAEAAEIRAECETAMLEHFYKVAQTMPPEQGKRYLSWVQQETLKPQHMMPGEARDVSPLDMR
jgi:nitrate reductase assembly molybdenum cofactor insertion protein NarJ